MIHLNFGDHRPLYLQICEKIKELIISGAIVENEKIPSVREMASILAINPNTIQKAYKELENEGYIYSQKAKGNFVSPRQQEPDTVKVTELMECLKQEVRELRFMNVKEAEIKNLIEMIYKEEQV